MATLSSNRLNDLIDRIFTWRREPDHAVFDITRREYSAIRVLADAPLPDSRAADDAWLQRVELRGSDAVVQLLQSGDFADQAGSMRALFVDDRCGFIGAHHVGSVADVDRERLATHILRLAANYQASGIILATNDRCGTVRAPDCRNLTMDIYRKGEATCVFLLDHFVLTRVGWKRMFAIRRGARF